MANTRQRVEKLEQTVGRANGPRFLPVAVLVGETKDVALERTRREDHLTRGQVAQVIYFGPGVEKQMETVDLIPGAADMDLARRREFWSEFYETIRRRPGQRLSTVLAADFDAHPR